MISGSVKKNHCSMDSISEIAGFKNGFSGASWKGYWYYNFLTMRVILHAMGAGRTKVRVRQGFETHICLWPDFREASCAGIITLKFSDDGSQCTYVHYCHIFLISHGHGAGRTKSRKGLDFETLLIDWSMIYRFLISNPIR